MQDMQLSQVLDYCITYDNQQHRAEKAAEKPHARKATQADWNAFLGR